MNFMSKRKRKPLSTKTSKRGKFGQWLVSGVRRIYADPAKLQRWYLVISILIILITFILLRREDISNHATVLSIELAVLSLIFAIGSAYRPKSRVVFIYKSKSYFSDEIVKGLQQAFSSRPDFELVCEEASKPENQSFEQRLSSAVYKYIFSPRLAAVIIRPSDISDQTQEIIASMLKLNVAVIIVDYDIGEEFDRLIDDNQPIYVLSDFRRGGKLVSSTIRSILGVNGGEQAEKAVILALGPDSSTTGSSRSKALIWDLLLNGHYNVVVPEVIGEWKPKLVCKQILQQIRKVDEGNIVVFAGNDNIARNLSMDLLTDPIAGKNVQIIGYDGIKEGDGKWMLEQFSHCIATIDVKAREQGREAARAVLEHVFGKTDSELQVIRTLPSLVKLKSFSSGPPMGSASCAAKSGDTASKNNG